MKIKYLSCLASIVLLSCNDSDKEESVDIYISNGKLQCQDNAIPINTTKSYLIEAGIDVLSQNCGVINAGYAAVCGGGLGLLHIYTIPLKEINNAVNIGFSDVSLLEDGYQEVDCNSL